MDGDSRRALALALLQDSESESSSSDSSIEESSSDSDCDMVTCKFTFQNLFRIPERRPKVVGFVEGVVHNYTEEEFRRHFRLPRAVVHWLVDGFAASDSCPSNNQGGIPAISCEVHILCFIWYAANKTSMREVATLFDVAESSIHRMLIRVADYILSLGPTVITFPADLKKLSQDFEKVSGMPGVVGCLDGSYIEIQCPSNKVAATYCNRHHYLSLTLQAVCDNKRRFVDACVGCSSKIHDSKVFRRSSLLKRLPVICQEGKYHVLGDAAYPVREYLLTPFRDYGVLSKNQRDFNAKFSATRVLIENAFGLLKKRFRQLIYLELRTVGWLNKFIMACCILHNLCIDSGDILPDELEESPADLQWMRPAEDANSEEETSEEHALRKLGELKREKVFTEIMRGRK